MAVVGYVIRGPDNDSYMYGGWKDADRCPVCQTVMDHKALNPGFALTKDEYDVSYTYDGALIVSQVVKRVLGAYPGVELLPLPRNVGFHLLNVSNVIEFDVERRTTRFEKFCDGCQRFRAVAGGTPAFVRATSLSEGVYRTDVEFGSDDERHPLVIVSPGVRDLLDAEGAGEGMYFKDVEGTRA